MLEVNNVRLLTPWMRWNSSEGGIRCSPEAARCDGAGLDLCDQYRKRVYVTAD